MADTVKVRIAMQSVRELELEVNDGAAIGKQLEEAMESGDVLVWVVDANGDRHGVSISKLAFVEIEGEAIRPGIGFAATE